MTIVYSPRALPDIDEALDYIAVDSPPAAERLAASELNGPPVRLRAGAQANRWSVPPFILYYRRTRQALVVLGVYHGARRPIEQ